MRLRFIMLFLMLFSLTFCAKHEMNAAFESKHDFSGRLLVMGASHRFQVEMDWAGDAGQGSIRLTHGMSGRIVDVRWQGRVMAWRDNQQSQAWQPLTEIDLQNMGVIFPPWVMARVFTGDLPDTMVSKDQRIWQGTMAGNELKIVWASAQQKVELTDIKNGRKAVVVFDER